MNNIVFRWATIKDLEDILRLNRELFLEEYKKFDKTLDINWTFGKEGRKFFKNTIIKKDNFCEVAENKNKTVGYLNGGVAKITPWRKRAKYAYLGSIFIEKKFRDRGIGTKLVKDFIDWCKRKKINFLSVAVSAGNNLGINFYKRRGFKEYDLTLEMKI